MLANELPNFDPNSLEGLICLIIIGICYGVGSPEYCTVKDNLFLTTTYDWNWLEIPLDQMSTKKQKFHNPEKTLIGQFYPENLDPNCYSIAESGRIVIFSDWATGTESAIAAVKAIAKFKPDYLIHLGDVYYSGRRVEQQKRLVQPLNAYLPVQTKVFLLFGNHDYYSGTEGIDYSLKVFGQNATYFSLYNSSLQIEGFDTGFNDSNCLKTLMPATYCTYIVDEELTWHKNRISVSKQQQRNTILLSHHQIISPWSAIGSLDGKSSPINHVFFDQVADFVSDSVLWFYGHEHAFAMLEPYTYNDVVIERPRLIGNGSCQARTNMVSYYETSTAGNFEVSPKVVPSPQLKDVFPSSFDNLLNNSFAVLDYTSKQIIVTYYELPQYKLGKFLAPEVLYRETIPLK